MSEDWSVSGDVWVTGLSEDEAREIENQIVEAIGQHKPTVTVTIHTPDGVAE